MVILISIILFVGLLALARLLYMSIKNNQVYDFTDWVLSISRDAYDSLPSYDDMMKSKKWPSKRNYFSKEQIKILDDLENQKRVKLEVQRKNLFK